MAYTFDNDDKPLPLFLASEDALHEFVRAWELETLPKAAWTHAAHVAVAANYAFDHSAEATFDKMKAGLLRFNTAAGTANTEDSGYHETLTRFWSGLVSEFVRRPEFSSRFEAVRGAVAEFGEDSNLYRRYYSFDVLKDRRARREWIPPDRTAERSAGVPPAREA